MYNSTCKNCKKNYDNAEVARIYGMESMPYVRGYCSAKCYTDMVIPVNEKVDFSDFGKTENPHDLLQKGRKYDALKKSNDELVEALKSTNALNLHLNEENTIGNRVYKQIQQALKNNEND